MASNKEYEALLNKYNISIARAQDLKEQLETKQRQWHERDEKFEVIEKLTRELCEDILAKDSREMVLGTDYSWSSIPIMELVVKARRIFKEYNENRTDFMNKILDISEQRRQEIESLNAQIMVMKTTPGAIAVSQEELKRQIEQEKREQEVLASLPPKLKETVEQSNTEIIMDSYDDVDVMEEDIYKDLAEKNEKAKITPKSIPITPNRKQVEKKRERKRNASMAHMVDLKEYEEKLDDVCWQILEIMGKEGVSIYMDIETAVMKAQPIITQNRCRVSINTLANIGLTRKEPIQNPLKGKLFIYQLTDMGSRVFQDKFGQVPVTSEMDVIMAEHDNCIHGYGIKFIADLLRETGDFTEVQDRNRKNPIKIGNGISYIPDIVCTDKNGAKMYIEYERVNHTQTNFNAKCNKMMMVTSVLNFIVPNQNDVLRIKKEIEAWIKSKGQKALSHVTIRVTGAYQLKGTDLDQNKSWKVVYQPGKRLEPYENF